MSDKKLQISSYLNDHSYPRLLIKHPGLIHFIYAWNQLLLQRNRVSYKFYNQQLRSMSSGTVLDAGSGEGMYIFPFARKLPHLQFEGWDKNSAHLGFCRQYQSAKRLNNTSFHQEDISGPTRSIEANLLLCIGTLQYIESDQETLQHLQQQLVENGSAIIYSPINGRKISLFHRYFFKRKNNYEKAQKRKRVYTEEVLLEKLDRAGFVVIDKQYTYGTLGIIAHEYYTLLLMGIGNSKYFFWVFMLLLLILLPFILLFIQVDLLLPKSSGNGCCLLLKKKTTNTILHEDH